MESSEPICRICFEHGSQNEPLYQPCLCSGTIKHVHASCLTHWQKTSGRAKTETCEICGAAFQYRTRGVDWTVIFGYFCLGIYIFTIAVMIPFGSLFLLAHITTPYHPFDVQLELCSAAWKDGFLAAVCPSIPVLILCMIILPGSDEPLLIHIPIRAAPVQRHLQRIASFYLYVLGFFCAYVLVIGAILVFGWILRKAIAWGSPSSVMTLVQFASALRRSPGLQQLATSMFAHLHPSQLQQVYVILSDMIVSYSLCTGACVVVVVGAGLTSCMLPLLTSVLTGFNLHFAVKRALQLAPMLALWLLTLDMQEVTGVNTLMQSCLGLDLSPLRWFWPLVYGGLVYAAVVDAVLELTWETKEYLWRMYEQYWDANRPYHEVCVDVLIGSIMLVSLYLAMVLIPLRYGHYLCPLASTAVHTVLRADGSSVQEMMPQFPSLFAVALGPAFGAYTVAPALASLAYHFAIGHIASADAPAPHCSIACRVSAVVLWLVVITVSSSWGVHSLYWLGVHLMGAILPERGWELPSSNSPDVQQILPLSIAAVGGSVYFVAMHTIRVILATRHEADNFLEWAEKWLLMIVVVSASAAAPVYLCGLVTQVVMFGETNATTIYPPKIGTVCFAGIIALNICYNTVKMLWTTGMSRAPLILLCIEATRILGWRRFDSSGVVRYIAIPLALLLLEVLVGGYFILRVSMYALCGAEQTDAAALHTAQYQCAERVMQRGPIWQFLGTLGILLARVAMAGLLHKVVPSVQRRELLNRVV